MPIPIDWPISWIKPCLGGVNASKITVLVYYTGQLSLAGYEIEETAQAKERKWAFGASYHISTVGPFQDEENELVFIDVVVGYQRVPRKATAAAAEDSEEDDGSEGFNRRSGTVTNLPPM